MRAKIFTFIIVAFTTIATFAQTQTNANETVPIKSQIIEDNAYQLFPTQNIWTFIKLDTRNGKMWQVHFTVDADGIDGELILNSESLVYKKEEVNGRFTLYPTENMYNFLLLDQINGYVYQVQWSMEANNRGIILID